MAAPDFYTLSQQLLAGDEQQMAPALERRCGMITRQVAADAARPGMLGLWGNSLNVDEHTGTIIVPPPILRALSQMSGVSFKQPIGHAGVTHTYGYLFSLIETPYGRKSDRWVQGQIADALGLPPEVLSPVPKVGTLLANATYVLGRIAFRGLPQHRLRSLRGAVPTAVIDYPFGKLRGHRIVETIVRAGRTIELVSDIVSPPGTSDRLPLLVYWYRHAGQAKLITAFPVSGEYQQLLLEPKRFGKNVDVRVQFNGSIAGLGGDGKLRGERVLVERGARMVKVTG